ncbi:MAG TPA: 2-amino-4-hydroxy-6-hydroxymethyldihydropteridine diphosphokinase [Methylophilus sp.]|jgi:2-amino-4-hydroxy-6-hydroxymethyldihydropteridine diphosphokinase|nr:2-amino-4-hydroxy-6-hydroxymethyldihydropteridine diphosphokinase [Methylophilus sp.]
MALALIALGSNLQQPQVQVANAIQVLSQTPGLRLVDASSLYATAPVGYDNQPDFINAVIQLSTEIPAPELMQLLLDIEQTFGRERPFPNAPRILDLDLLDYDGLRMETAHLTLPHPRMHERGFVILPLAEIVPDFILPQGQTVVEWVAEFPHDDVRKLDH